MGEYECRECECEYHASDQPNTQNHTGNLQPNTEAHTTEPNVCTYEHPSNNEIEKTRVLSTRLTCPYTQYARTQLTLTHNLRTHNQHAHTQPEQEANK